MSTGAKSISMSSCYMSVRTPNTHIGTKSKAGSSLGALNRTVDNWYSNKKKNAEVYSTFSKGSLNKSSYDMQREQILE